MNSPNYTGSTNPIYNLRELQSNQIKVIEVLAFQFKYQMIATGSLDKRKKGVEIVTHVRMKT